MFLPGHALRLRAYQIYAGVDRFERRRHNVEPDADILDIVRLTRFTHFFDSVGYVTQLVRDLIQF
jgi:hypothetical protein